MATLTAAHSGTFRIGGMSCGACARHVTRALDGMTGVVHAEVDFPKSEATVEHLPAFTDETAIIAAIRDAGYTARATSPRSGAVVGSVPEAREASSGCGCR